MDRLRKERKSNLDSLAELKRARAGGRRQLKVSFFIFDASQSCYLLKNIIQEEDVQIYDEVTEDQYESIVKGRLQKDDFVIDDGVEGYMDNGMDDWVGQEDKESEEEIDRKRKDMYNILFRHDKGRAQTTHCQLRRMTLRRDGRSPNRYLLLHHLSARIGPQCQPNKTASCLQS